MKWSFLFLLLFSFPVFADLTSSPGPMMPAIPIQQKASLIIPVGSVAVATPAAPPSWAQDLIVTVEKLPVVGPFVAKALLYLGILASILTVLVATILTILNSLSGVFTASGLSEAAAAIIKFRDGPIMYWLKFLSLFNAQKPASIPPVPPPAIKQ